MSSIQNLWLANKILSFERFLFFLNIYGSLENWIEYLVPLDCELFLSLDQSADRPFSRKCRTHWTLKRLFWWKLDYINLIQSPCFKKYKKLGGSESFFPMRLNAPSCQFCLGRWWFHICTLLFTKFLIYTWHAGLQQGISHLQINAQTTTQSLLDNKEIKNKQMWISHTHLCAHLFRRFFNIHGILSVYLFPSSKTCVVKPVDC